MTRLIVICSLLLAFVDAGGFYIQYVRTQGKYIMSYDNLPVHFDFNMLEKLPIDSNALVWRYEIMNKGDSILALEDGTFNVFLLEGDYWKNLYLGWYKGYNFYSNAFIKDGNLYSIGGYGYWEYHSKLIRFDFNAGGWEIVSTYNTPKDLEPLLIAYTDDGIQLLFGGYKDQISNITSLSSDIYTLDYKTWTYSRTQHNITLSNEIVYPIKSIINTKKYCVTSFKINTYPTLLIYNKQSGELRLNQNFDPIDLSHNQCIYTDGDTILKYDPILKEFRGFDIQTAWQTGEPLNYNRSQITHIQWALIASGLVLIFLVYWFSKKLFLKNVSRPAFSESTHPELTDTYPSGKFHKIILTLLQTESEIDCNDLDEIFGISDMPHDLRRVKRSQLVNKVNNEYMQSNGYVLVERIRQEDDRRYIKYRINRT